MQQLRFNNCKTTIVQQHISERTHTLRRTIFFLFWPEFVFVFFPWIFLLFFKTISENWLECVLVIFQWRRKTPMSSRIFKEKQFRIFWNILILDIWKFEKNVSKLSFQSIWNNLKTFENCGKFWRKTNILKCSELLLLIIVNNSEMIFVIWIFWNITW